MYIFWSTFINTKRSPSQCRASGMELLCLCSVLAHVCRPCVLATKLERLVLCDWLFYVTCTIFQLYMWRHIDVQADWRNWTLVGLLTPEAFRRVFVTCPSKYRHHGHGTILFTVISRKRPISVARFTTRIGIQRTYSRLKPPGSNGGRGGRVLTPKLWKNSTEDMTVGK